MVGRRLTAVTIVASVKVRDGLVLGTDSMTQISAPTPEGGVQVLKAYSNARKLFQIKDAPVGVMTYGLGNIGNRSIEGLVLDFCRTPEADIGTIEEITANLYAFVSAQYNDVFGELQQEQRPVTGFFVAGYSEDAPFPEEFEFVFPRDEAPVPARGADEFGAGWRGFDAPFIRLYKGFDPYVIPSRLQARGLTEDDLNEVFSADGLETAVIFDGMPVQDAINFAAYILDTTIGWTTFALGAPACGRPLQVATILADGGFQWVEKPELRVQA